MFILSLFRLAVYPLFNDAKLVCKEYVSLIKVKMRMNKRE